MDLPLAQAAAPPGALSEGAEPEATPQELVAWALARFAGRKLVVTTGFGMEGCAMIDMVAEASAAAGRRTDIAWIDTDFLFPETHELRARLAARYPAIALVRHATALSPAAQEAEHGAALWTRDPDLCCHLRKVEPMRALMQGADAWMTALRRDQSATRADTAPVAWDWLWQVVKVSPLSGWGREQVWAYVQERGVPFNALHERGYPSVGCMQCTRPVEGARPEVYSRAGRWADSAKTECGIHARPGHPAAAPAPAGGRERP